MYRSYFEELENIMRKNLDKRGMDKIRLTGELEKGTRELLESKVVFIVTGFCIKDALKGETDGPIGAVSLAGALENLGKEVILITDEYSRDMVYRCCLVKGIVAPVKIVPYEEAEAFCEKLIEIHKPSHIVAIERPGKAKDGKYYSMRGEDLSDIIPNTDPLFKKGKELKIKTLAVGDGGNELGMGKVSSFVRNNVPNGEKICASISADYLIVAGVSNWGAHAIVGALSLMTNQMLLHDLKTEICLLEEMIKAGGVDGCTKRCELTVDGLSLEENLEILQKLRSVAESVINKHKNNMLAG
ncbi:DUF4392 domain-containing protein [Crassaminicella profunda]|uniref:DUF4392 domain-containing protein n=1 Tax=Crassaminicella profunda TaxID=1286698 RepID=UPI001CA75745|nr:DUF4392 domain-containing protein [Crassaminicella profunda]QZY54032.1 DUF4392 domain-containing protein [Crassaminicella profunda]